VSTRGIVARVGKNEGEFSGRYTHSDSMPMSRGPLLWKMLHEEFTGDLKRMLRYLIDEHKAGWSSLIPEHRSCYCHPENTNRADFKGRRPEPAQTFTHKNVTDSDAEWLYVFDVNEWRLCVRDLRHDAESIVDLKGPEPTPEQWRIIECGENFERCSHYAWAHNLVPRTCNLSTQTWLGRKPLDFHDACAFIISGKRYTATGSGGQSDFYNSVSHRFGKDFKPFPRGTWIASVKAGNGRRMEFPVAKIDGEKYTPFPGVVWVYPPTQDDPKETMVQS
jgi:hypothetical protein